MQWAGAGANREQGVAGTATHNLHPQSDIPGTGAAPRISPEATALPQLADVRFQSQDYSGRSPSHEEIAHETVEAFYPSSPDQEENNTNISPAGSDSSDNTLGKEQSGSFTSEEDGENTNISSDTGTVLAAGASFDDQEDEDDSANLRRQSDIPGTTEVHPQDGKNNNISPTDKEDDVEDGSAKEASSVGNESEAEYQLVEIVDPEKTEHDCFVCGNAAQSKWDLVGGPPNVDGLTSWHYCPGCQLSDFLTDPETGKPLVSGEWPPIEEVGEKCFVEDVGHYWRKENGEDKLICNVCYENQRPKKRPRIKRISFSDGGSQSSARPNGWKPRDETSDSPKGFYVTLKWYSENPDCQRCCGCNKYFRPMETK